MAVIGAGMAGRAHAAGYRGASTVFDAERPEVRLVAIADVNQSLREDVCRRYDFARSEPNWETIVSAGDIDAVSVVVANDLHREMVEALLAAGKHVLCEKPLAPSTVDAEAMAAAAEKSGLVAAAGFTYRRSPAISAIRDEVTGGRLGDVLHFSGRAWFDYALESSAPITWRYKGGPGSGVLADVGSHLVDVAEFICGPITKITGGAVATVIGERPVPAGPTVGHAPAPLTDVRAPVENEDIATFTARFASGALGTFSASRVAHCRPDGLGFEVFCADGSAAFDLHRLSEFIISDRSPGASVNGPRRVLIGPQHPYVTLGLPIDSAGVGHGTADLFIYQARAFLDEIVGIEALPRCASFAEAVHGMRVLDAVVGSAARDGSAVAIG